MDELTAFMVYCCAVRVNKGGTIMGKLQAIEFFTINGWVCVISG